MRDKVVNLFTTFFKLDVIRLTRARVINRLIPIYDCIKKILDNSKKWVYNKRKKGGDDMSVSRKVERELIRAHYLDEVVELLTNKGEEVLRVKSNEIAVPVVGCEGNEDFLVITFKVPTGADKGMTVYDGYAMAEEYELKLKTKADKARESAERKAKKVARDAEIRKRKAEISAKREG